MPADLDFRAEKDLLAGSGALDAIAVQRFDELADEGHVHGAHQVSREHEAVFQHRQNVHGLAAVVIADLAAHFAHAFLDLLGANHRFQVGGHRGHAVRGQVRLLLRPGSMPAEGYSAPGAACCKAYSWMSSPSFPPPGASNCRGGRKPRTQITSS